MQPPSTLPASVYQNPAPTPKIAPAASFSEVPLSGAATNVNALSRMYTTGAHAPACSTVSRQRSVPPNAATTSMVTTVLTATTAQPASTARTDDTPPVAALAVTARPLTAPPGPAPAAPRSRSIAADATRPAPRRGVNGAGRVGAPQEVTFWAWCGVESARKVAFCAPCDRASRRDIGRTRVQG
jgi:hypothetical protein